VIRTVQEAVVEVGCLADSLVELCELLCGARSGQLRNNLYQETLLHLANSSPLPQQPLQQMIAITALLLEYNPAGCAIHTDILTIRNHILTLRKPDL
jgi:hypothetical protein